MCVCILFVMYHMSDVCMYLVCNVSCDVSIIGVLCV